VLFSGRDDPTTTTTSSSTSSTTTSTTSTTTTTTTTTPPPTTTPTTAPTTTPPSAPAPAPPAAAPAPQPAPAPAPPASFCDGSGGAVLSAMNGDRAANGAAPLCGNSQLSGIAQNWANWMAAHGSLTHQDLNALIGSTPFSTIGENILVGPGNMSSAEMEVAWMNSPPHRANILSRSFSAAGVGIAFGADGRVWVAVDFGG
jgi:uncharacterized protein YkwD